MCAIPQSQTNTPKLQVNPRQLITEWVSKFVALYFYFICSHYRFGSNGHRIPTNRSNGDVFYGIFLTLFL